MTVGKKNTLFRENDLANSAVFTVKTPHFSGTPTAQYFKLPDKNF